MLSEEERKKCVSQRDSFLELEKRLGCKIAVLDRYKNSLTKRLADSRPKTPNGEFPCETCHTISMAYNPTKSGMGDAQFNVEEPPVFTQIDIYDCEICGRTERRYPDADSY